MIKIEITAETAEQLEVSMKALGWVRAATARLDVVLNGADIATAGDKAMEAAHIEPASAPAEETPAPAEETKTRKRRSKAEIEAEKNAAATKEEPTAEGETPEETPAADDDDLTTEDDDDLAGGEEAEVTLDDMRPIVQELGRSNKKPQVVALLKEFGAAKLPEVKKEDYKAFYAKLLKI